MYPAWTSLKADFVTKCKIIREKVESREQEVHGKWLTEEGMRKANKWSTSAIKQMVSYCKKFPETLVRLEGVFACETIFAYIQI